MKLTALKAKQAKAKDKDYKLADGHGLHLLVKKNGNKYWRLKYYFRGKEKLLSIGTFHELTLKQAREAAAEARYTLKHEGKDPMALRKMEKLAKQSGCTFEEIAVEWMATMGTWTDTHRNRVSKSLEADVYKYIGDMPIIDIQPTDLLSVIRRVEKRDALDVASRILQRSGAVFRYAIQTGRATINPATELEGVLKTRKVKHVDSIPPSELPGLIEAIGRYHGNIVTKYALRLLMLTFVRPGELRFAEWPEFDIEKAEWRIPAERMKMGTEHIVPLSRQALEIVKEMHSITGSSIFVFRGERTMLKPFSENTLSVALHRLGYKGRATPHGFRATASSALNEQGFNPDAIERQLSHTDRNNVRSAYTHHARYLDERRIMMQWWADHLDSLTSNVAPIGTVKR